MTLLEAIRSRPRLQWEKRRSAENLERAAEAIAVAFPEFSRRESFELSERLQAMEAAARQWEWNGITVGDVSLVAKADLAGEVSPSPYLKAFLRREMETSTSPLILQAAVEAYFDGWERNGAGSVWLAAILQGKLDRLPGRWRHLLVALPEFFDTAHAPELIAARMVAADDPYSWLRGLGLASPHSGPLMGLVHDAWLRIIPDIRTNDQVRQVFAWIRPSGAPGADDRMAAGAIEKLLAPWHRDVPDNALREELLERIVGEWGDPRNTRAEFWSLVDQPAKTVLVRWLAGESMDALLNVITKSIKNSMWGPRHDFWKGLYNRGLVDEAWVALSAPAAEMARTMFEQTKDPLLTMFANQTARNRRETCLLIMRIGRYTVVEGSHDYRVHVFLPGDRRAPKLYQEVYDAERLTFPAHDPMARMHDQYGHWTKWVADRVLR